MIVGTEWLIEAFGCDENALREMKILREVFARIIADLGLKTINDGIWHQFAGEKGITGLVALTESHLACHTYPEYQTATFNLYCCKTRPEWNWDVNLKELLDAETVNVQKIERGNSEVQDSKSETKNRRPKTEDQKLKSAGGEFVSVLKANCPNCAAPIEFQKGSTIVLVCPFCRSAVARTDRGLKIWAKSRRSPIRNRL